MGLAALLTLAAIVGKQACALGGLGTALDKMAIGLGMIPRGEVGLIFANIGLGSRCTESGSSTSGSSRAVVVAVIAATLLMPPVLKWQMDGGGRSLVVQRAILAEAAG